LLLKAYLKNSFFLSFSKVSLGIPFFFTGGRLWANSFAVYPSKTALFGVIVKSSFAVSLDLGLGVVESSLFLPSEFRLSNSTLQGLKIDLMVPLSYAFKLVASFICFSSAA